MKRACPGPEQSSPRIRSAARWFVALQDAEVSSRLVRRWEAWNADPDRRHAFDELVHLWRRLNDGARPLSPSPAELAEDDYDGSLSVAEWLELSKGARRVRGVVRRRLRASAAVIGAAAVFALIVAGGVALLSTYLQPLRSFAPMSVYETQRGEHRRIVLTDGTRVDLGARSALTANVTPYVRTVVLDRGEALFHVARDAERPFRVIAGRGTITAIGTAFNVQRRDEGSVVVTVTEGSVEVAPELSASSGSGRRVDRGHQVSYDPSGRLGRVLVADSATVLGWREGRLRYASEPLHRVLADVNRYSRRTLVVGDRAAGELLYSGTVFEADVDEWIHGLERIFPSLEIIATDDEHVLIRTRLEVPLSSSVD
jgi:transmembrane sensor